MSKLTKIAFVAAFAVVAGYGVYENQKADTMSDMMLANVEALARYEINPDCPNGCTSCDFALCYCFRIYSDMREVHWE